MSYIGRPLRRIEDRLLLLGAGTFAAVLVADPWAALAVGDLIYLGMLPFSVRSFQRLKREAEDIRDVADAE